MKTFKTLPPAVRAERRAYAWFFGALLAVVALCTWGTAFNPFSLFAETMEDLSQDCLESLLAGGATFPQRVAHGILPSCLSGLVSWYLYSLEVNIRASAVVGMVGGGGIGLVLFSYIKSFNYHVAFFIIILIAALARVVAWVGMRLEINVAECAILGMVGAGGVGFVIANGIQNYEYGSAGVAILLVFVMAYFTERLFVFLKRRLR